MNSFVIYNENNTCKIWKNFYQSIKFGTHSDHFNEGNKYFCPENYAKNVEHIIELRGEQVGATWQRTTMTTRYLKTDVPLKTRTKKTKHTC